MAENRRKGKNYKFNHVIVRIILFCNCLTNITDIFIFNTGNQICLSY
jgi:hypothetical protein